MPPPLWILTLFCRTAWWLMPPLLNISNAQFAPPLIKCLGETLLCLGTRLPICYVFLQVGDGLCEGTKNGERGKFHTNFVQMRPATVDVTSAADSAPPEQTTPPDPTPNESPDITRETGNIPPPPSLSHHHHHHVLHDSGPADKVQRVKVLYRYEAQEPDDLTLEPGQVRECHHFT